MEVCHDGKPEPNANHAPEFDAVIRRHAREHGVRDFLIVSDDGAAGGEDERTREHPADTKMPIHKHIIS